MTATGQQRLVVVLGANEPGVFVSARVIEWIDRQPAFITAYTRVRGENRSLDLALTEVTNVGYRYRSWIEGRTSAATSAIASATGDSAEVEPVWMTTEQAAARLGKTARAVRADIAAGRLGARRAGRCWLVSLDRAAAATGADQGSTTT